MNTDFSPVYGSADRFVGRSGDRGPFNGLLHGPFNKSFDLSFCGPFCGLFHGPFRGPFGGLTVLVACFGVHWEERVQG